jgi:hypothetical protein
MPARRRGICNHCGLLTEWACSDDGKEWNRCGKCAVARLADGATDKCHGRKIPLFLFFEKIPAIHTYIPRANLYISTTGKKTVGGDFFGQQTVQYGISRLQVPESAEHHQCGGDRPGHRLLSPDAGNLCSHHQCPPEFSPEKSPQEEKVRVLRLGDAGLQEDQLSPPVYHRTDG